MSGFIEAMQSRVLVCDGAMGTMLHAAGCSLDKALPQLNVVNPSLVSAVHESYIDAGVDVILTNTFGANRLRLAAHGCAGEVEEINSAGVALARSAVAASQRSVFIGGSVSPCVSEGQRGTFSVDDRADTLRQQIMTLVSAGVDLVVLETFGFLDELIEAVRITAGLTELPIVAQATFTSEGQMLGGETPQQVADALAGLPLTALGANCTVGPQRMLEIVEQLCRHSGFPVSALPNVGLPRRLAGGQFEYSTDGDYFARYASRYVSAGAAIIGGCCGTGPTHIRAAVDALASRGARRVTRTSTQRPRPDVLTRQLAERRFVTAAKIVSPWGSKLDAAADLAAELRPYTDLVVVSAITGSAEQGSSTSVALHLRDSTGMEPIATFTTWDKTIMSLQADLLGAHALGIGAVVCETGNPPLRGDYPNADGIWEVDSVGLIALVAGLNAGHDCDGLQLAVTTAFRIGAYFNPGNDDENAELARIRAKVAAGAEFLVTRPVYGVDDRFRRLLAELADLNVPVLATISPLNGFAEAEYLRHEVPDVAVPDHVMSELVHAETEKQASSTAFKLAEDLLRELREMCQGAVVVASRDNVVAAQQLLSAVATDQNLGSAAQS